MTIQIQTSAYNTIRKGSLSFSLASAFLPRRARDSIVLLYFWCRHCDDVVDGTTEPLESNPEEAQRAFFLVQSRTNLPSSYRERFLEGLRWDLEQRRYATLIELESYCYRVAGIIGVMIAHILGVTSSRQMSHAVALGNAMQLTNICRDVKADSAIGRQYIPGELLKVLNLDDRRGREEAFAAVTVLLTRAAGLYRFGRSGIRYLPFRCAFAIYAASYIYEEIGNKILKTGPDALLRRTQVSSLGKIKCLGFALRDTLKLALTKALRMQNSVSMEKIL